MGNAVTCRQFPQVYHVEPDQLVNGQPELAVVLIQAGFGLAVDVRHGRQVPGNYRRRPGGRRGGIHRSAIRGRRGHGRRRTASIPAGSSRNRAWPRSSSRFISGRGLIIRAAGPGTARPPAGWGFSGIRPLVSGSLRTSRRPLPDRRTPCPHDNRFAAVSLAVFIFPRIVAVLRDSSRLAAGRIRPCFPQTLFKTAGFLCLNSSWSPALFDKRHVQSPFLLRLIAECLVLVIHLIGCRLKNRLFETGAV